VYISPYCRLALVPPNFMKFGIRGQLTDVITCVKFCESVHGLRSSDTPKLPFPIDLLRRPYNSVRTAVRNCDLMSRNSYQAFVTLNTCSRSFNVIHSFMSAWRVVNYW